MLYIRDLLRIEIIRTIYLKKGAEYALFFDKIKKTM